jgi:DNA-binding XRE family transcriptional regulator
MSFYNNFSKNLQWDIDKKSDKWIIEGMKEKPATVSELARLFNGATGREKVEIQKKLLAAIKNSDEKIPARKGRGQELRTLRRLLNVTQVQLAHAAGVNAEYICKIERGTYAATEDILDRLFEALKGWGDVADSE